MVMLAKDKEKGKIKSIIPTEHGMKVEMYSADAAQIALARVHGAFEKDNRQAAPIVKLKIGYGGVADDERDT